MLNLIYMVSNHNTISISNHFTGINEAIGLTPHNKATQNDDTLNVLNTDGGLSSIVSSPSKALTVTCGIPFRGASVRVSSARAPVPIPVRIPPTEQNS